MDNNVQIYFERYGGFTGIPMKARINSDDLSEQEADELVLMLNNARLPDLKIQPSEKRAVPDQFGYHLTVEMNGIEYEFELQESVMPESLRPLVSYLMNKVRR